MSDSRAMATALVKVHAFSGLWDALQNSAAEALKEGKVYVNASKTYAEAVANYARPEALNGLTESQLAHPTDSHPALGLRLQSLGSSVEQVASDAVNVNPTQPAIAFVPKAEAEEEEISTMYQVMLARRLGIDLDSVPEGSSQDG